MLGVSKSNTKSRESEVGMSRCRRLHMYVFVRSCQSHTSASCGQLLGHRKHNMQLTNTTIHCQATNPLPCSYQLPLTFMLPNVGKIHVCEPKDLERHFMSTPSLVSIFHLSISIQTAAPGTDKTPAAADMLDIMWRRA